MQSSPTAAANPRKRARVSNACARCRQHKIKCSGKYPCEQCTKRGNACNFDPASNKILVESSYLERLERQAAARIVGFSQPDDDSSLPPRPSLRPHQRSLSTTSVTAASAHSLPTNLPQEQPSADAYTRRYSETIHARPALSSTHQHHPHQQQQQQHHALHDNSNTEEGGSSIAPDEISHNPLLPGNSPSYTFDAAGKLVFLGTSSNWSFARRILGMIYERVGSSCMPSSSLLFESATYDLGWDGRRDNIVVENASLPTADYAIFLINAVKFHCGRLFHVFDEQTFMSHFKRFHDSDDAKGDIPILWYVHYLLILAFGKEFVVRAAKGRKPAGADLYVKAAKLLPDIIYLRTDPIQSIEILICAALYLQCLDLRSGAHNMIGQAMRLCLENGMHTDFTAEHLGDEALIRSRSAWWTVYILDRRISALMGTPVSISDEDISASIPVYPGSSKVSAALAHHIQLSKATSAILHTVYSKDGKERSKFFDSVKDGIKIVAEGSEERSKYFPLDLQNCEFGICRLSAYLHLFHHQTLILATRPFLFSFWQRQIDIQRSRRTLPGTRTQMILRVCVNSAKQIISIVSSLREQTLLDSFIPFDREAVYSAAIILSITATIDESVHTEKPHWLDKAYDVLDDMTSRGNLIAPFHKVELQLLNDAMTQLDNAHAAPERSEKLGHGNADAHVLSNDGTIDHLSMAADELGDVDSDEWFGSENMLSFAEAFNFSQLEALPS